MSRAAFADFLKPRPDREPGTAPLAGPESMEPASEDGRPVCEEAYWRDYYDRDEIRYEWNDGRLEEMPVSDVETLAMYLWLLDVLRRYLESHPLGQIVAPDVGFRLALSSGVKIRRPDCAVVRHDNPVPLEMRRNSYRGIYDLCIEALSDLRPADIRRDTVVKKAEYAAGGVPEYYILHHDPRHWAFYSRTDDGLYAPIAPQEGVIVSRVLPGFRLRLDDLQARRPLRELSDDPMYADFVLPEWKQDRQRAVAEAVARREAERQAVAEAAARREAEQRAAAEARARADAEARERALEQRLAELQARADGRGDLER